MTGIPTVRGLVRTSLATFLTIAFMASTGTAKGYPRITRLESGAQKKLRMLARNQSMLKKMIDKYGSPAYRVDVNKKWVCYVYPMRNLIFYFYKHNNKLIARGRKYLSISPFHQAIMFRDWSYRRRYQNRSLFKKGYKTRSPLYKTPSQPSPSPVPH